MVKKLFYGLYRFIKVIKSEQQLVAEPTEIEA